MRKEGKLKPCLAGLIRLTTKPTALEESKVIHRVLGASQGASRASDQGSKERNALETSQL